MEEAGQPAGVPARRIPSKGGGASDAFKADAHDAFVDPPQSHNSVGLWSYKTLRKFPVLPRP